MSMKVKDTFEKIFVFRENEIHWLGLRKIRQCNREPIILNTTVYAKQIILQLCQFLKKNTSTRAMKKGKCE